MSCRKLARLIFTSLLGEGKEIADDDAMMLDWWCRGIAVSAVMVLCSIVRLYRGRELHKAAGTGRCRWDVELRFGYYVKAVILHTALS